MKSLVNKTFLIGLLITVVAIVITSFKDIKMLFNPETAVLGESEQKILLDETIPQLIPPTIEEETVETSSLQVPFIWKYEIISNNGTNDAIHGYIPNLTEYEIWYSYVYENIEEIDHFEDIQNIEYKNVEVLKGISNESSEFAYNENLCTKVSTDDKHVAVCPKWISLSNNTILNKNYILVRCSIFDDHQKQGYCLFEDYRPLYYNYAKDMDTECLGKDIDNLYCNLEDYLNILE
jgi:hypothetical protein